MLSASMKAISLSQTPPMDNPMPMSRPSPSPQTAAIASGSIPSVTSPGQGSMSTRRPSFNIRDFMVDNDVDQATSSMFKFMDEDAIIRAQVEALEALNEAALTRALQESEAMAASEEERRKQAERAVENANGSDASSAMNSTVVPVTHAIRERDPSSQSCPSPQSESTMPTGRYNNDEAAARLLAREWRVASLQGALLKNPDVTPHTFTSISHTPTSSAVTVPATLLPRKVPSSSTRPPPITIPAAEFFARSPPKVHYRQSSSTASRASASSKPSPALPGDFKDRPLPRPYTSASSAAASQYATKSADRANPAPQGASSSINMHIKAHQVSSASSKPNSSRTWDAGKAPAETVSIKRATSPEKPRTSNPTPAVASNGEQKRGIDIKSSDKSAHTSTLMRTIDIQKTPTSSRSSSATTSPHSTPNTSPGISPSSSLSASLNVSTSASKFAAAERERARASKQVLVSVPAPVFTPVKPVAVALHQKTNTSPHSPVSLDTSPSSSVLMSPPPFQNSVVQARSILLESSTQKTAPPSEAQAVPNPVKNLMVVPISSLSESDDEDDGRSDSENEDEDEEWEVIDHESVPLRYLFTSSHSCTKCGGSILSPRNVLYKQSESMHISCTKCATTYCRGCFTVAKCPRNCSGSKACSLMACCSQVGSVAIFEALSSFDHDFLREAGLSANQKLEREKYIQNMITRNGTSDLEKTFVQTTRTIVTLLTSSPKIDPSLGELFERAMLTEVVHGFLNNQVIRDWIAHSDAYCAILDLLRYMVDASLGDAMAWPVKRNVATTCGLKKWMWGTGTIIWATDSCGQRDPSKGQELYRGELKGGTEECASLRVNENLVSAVPLGELVNQLESLTGPLSSLSQKLQFSATVQKVNALCDRISQLVVQQVLASF